MGIYHPRPQSTMVATKVLISLCVYGLAAAAPQLGQNLNQEVIVNDVVTALQPSIAEAVANALRGLSTSSVTSFNSGSAGFSGLSSSTNSGFSSTGFSSNSGSSTGFSSNSGSSTGFSSNSGSSSGSVTGFAAGGSSSGSAAGFAANSGSGSGFAANSGSASGFAAGGSSSSSAAKGASADEGIMTRPEYNFQFNVADDDSQTYITQQENRDGDAVTGTYSYVDPSGTLVTVNYQAGPEGYAQTVDTQEGFVTISEENKAKINNAAAANNAAGFSSSTGSSTGFSSSTQGGQVSTATSSAIDQNALIAQIMAVLQPQISSAVNSAILQQQSTTTTVGNSFRGNVAQAGNSFRGNTATRGQLSGSKSFQGSQTGASFGQSAQRGQQVSTVNYNGASSESALIAQILAVLQPQISSAVNTAVRQQQSTTTSSRRVQSAQTGFRAASQQTGFSSANRQTGFRATSQRVSGDRLTPLFGN